MAVGLLTERPGTSTGSRSAIALARATSRAPSESYFTVSSLLVVGAVTATALAAWYAFQYARNFFRLCAKVCSLKWGLW
jgi:hypothetical protein